MKSESDVRSEWMSWETVVEVQSQFDHFSLLGKRTENQSWQFKWYYGQQNFENSFEVTLTRPNEDVELTVSRESNKCDTVEEAMASFDWAKMTPITIDSNFSEEIWVEVAKSNLRMDLKLKWFKLCFPSKKDVITLVSYLYNSSHTVILLGESTSNVNPNSSDIWSFVDERNIATTSTFEGNYPIFQKYFIHKIKEADQPTLKELHHHIAQLEKKQLIQCVITQSVLGAHKKANLQNVIEILGTLSNFYCHECGEPCNIKTFVNEKDCFECGGKIRPSIVLKGEKFPKSLWSSALQQLKQAELVICISEQGPSSLQRKLLNEAVGKVIFIHEVEDTKMNESNVLPVSAIHLFKDVCKRFC
jgi:NAD-dependent deacetylase